MEYYTICAVGSARIIQSYDGFYFFFVYRTLGASDQWSIVIEFIEFKEQARVVCLWKRRKNWINGKRSRNQMSIFHQISHSFQFLFLYICRLSLDACVYEFIVFVCWSNQSFNVTYQKRKMATKLCCFLYIFFFCSPNYDIFETFPCWQYLYGHGYLEFCFDNVAFLFAEFAFLR